VRRVAGPRYRGETPRARAGCQKPVRRRQPSSGEQARGPQHQVKPAASIDPQSGSRAAHVTAKATSATSVPKRAAGSGGVGGAARVQGGVRNTRDPSAWPPSGQGASYEPKAKSTATQRESEGIVVPSMVATNNAAGAKGSCGGHVGRAGMRKGMAARSGPNYPARRQPVDKVQLLQRRLWAAAKRSPGRRFHALCDRIWRDDVLWEAWRRVRRNRGAAGIDGLPTSPWQPPPGHYPQTSIRVRRKSRSRSRSIARCDAAGELYQQAGEQGEGVVSTPNTPRGTEVSPR
jgi:hypothetical protein